MADLFEAVVGEISASSGIPDLSSVQRDDGSWLLDGLLTIDEVEDLLDEDIFPDDERSDYDTLGGFVMMRIGRIPSPADNFEWEGLAFEVMDMDGRRVDKVLVKRVISETTSTTSADLK